LSSTEKRCCNSYSFEEHFNHYNFENKIPGSVADDLAIAIYINCKIERLHLADNNLQYQGAVVASALSQIKTLIELNLDNNNMTEKVADDLALAIESNKSLQILRVGGNDLRSDGIIRISNSTSCLSKLRILAMNNNQITEAADAIAVAIYILQYPVGSIKS